MKKISFILGVILMAASSLVMAKYEQEQMQIETQLQQRIEGILSKTLPPNSYLVTVKVEMENSERPISRQTTQTKRNFTQNQYVLPGVPQKKEFASQPDGSGDTSVSGFSVETLVKRIQISILVAPDISSDQIRGVRDVISASIPFNPLRGDEMDIQNSSLLKPVNPGSNLAANAAARSNAANSGFWSTVWDHVNTSVVVLVGVTILIGLVMAFLFGPVRAFLNRLITVLPRIGEQAAYTVSNAPAKPAPGTTAGGMFGQGANGNGSHDAEEEGARPFRFIRDDQLNKLPILFKGMSAAQCALVLAYLPAEWASKVLATLDPQVQTTIMAELSQGREVPSQIVQELEEQIKAKLPYLVGGVEWISSVYQMTQPETQRALLGTLNQQSPELAQALRRKTFFIEDLSVVSAGALRLLFQEVGYPTAALALRDEKPETRQALLRRLPVAVREIMQQELDLSADDRNAIDDAKTRLLEIGRRLLAEGRMTLPEARAR